MENLSAFSVSAHLVLLASPRTFWAGLLFMDASFIVALLIVVPLRERGSVQKGRSSIRYR